ncbi:cellulose binding domain-containing protein [Planotetraspora sp. GP83]|uniref:cellulose binding domain-containing protein n=1 Tax=Planotetraspora sp. GP83 TaxID=3156264 RepID=UPI003515B5AF
MRRITPLAWLGLVAALLAALVVGAVTAPAMGAALATPAPSPSPSGSPGPQPLQPVWNPNCPPPPLPAGGQGYAPLCWFAPSGFPATGYDVYVLQAAGFTKVASTTYTSAILGGFTFGRTYTFYVIAKDASGNLSRPSLPRNVIAVSGVAPTPTPTPTGDTTPPSTPTGLRDNCVADFPGTAFCWTPSTDNVGVTGYLVFRQTATGYVKAGTSSHPGFMEGGLVTGQRYLYFVVAVDAAGNLSPASDLVSVLAREGLPIPTPSCKVAYTQSVWETGMSVTVTITNTDTKPINGWKLAFTFPNAGERLTPPGWSAVWTQTGSTVTATNIGWNQTLSPGQSTQIGFSGTHTGSAAKPAAFTLNGAACAVA